MNRVGLVIIIILLSGLIGNNVFGAANISVNEYSYSAGNVMQVKQSNMILQLKIPAMNRSHWN